MIMMMITRKICEHTTNASADNITASPAIAKPTVTAASIAIAADITASTAPTDMLQLLLP